MVKNEKYLTSLFLTILVFAIGIIIGERVSSFQYKRITSEISERSLDLESVLLQELLTEIVYKGNCKAIGKSIETSIKILDKAKAKLDLLEKKKDFSLDYWRFKREYTQSLIRLYLITEKYSNECNENIVNILFFYVQNCDECYKQSIILDKTQRSYEKNVYVYYIDVSLEDKEPLISTLRYIHEITIFPTIIMKNYKFEGLADENKLKNIIDQILYAR